jgi:predicted transcriptional regulator
MPKGRPKGDGNRLKRLRAFELYCGGNKKSEIANTLGVTKASVSAWAKKDLWQDRLSQIAARAGEAVDHVVGETIADVATRIRAKYEQRLQELDHICTSSLTPPQARISAIKAWFEIGNKVQIDPTRPLNDPKNLTMIQDLLEELPAQPPVGASDSTGQG